ncbi:hypothetical protein [Spirillospora sp. CA-294931]|uniref:hypothetical protein n=1 Tax=Spirillospora sp. CA-294931 TaxID=3240042 RepID=UPI003D9352FB
MADETERSYPFSDGPGEFVTESDWTAMVLPWADNGVHGHPGLPQLTIQPGNEPGTIQINPGDGSVSGYHYRLTAPKVLTTVPNAGTTDRWDVVVLHLDRANHEIRPILLAGTNIYAIGPDRTPIGAWRQPPASQVTSEFWGAAVDGRWFMGARVRPYLPGAVPPATPGEVIYNPRETGAGTVLLGRLHEDGRPYWAPWYPLSSERMDPVEAEHNADVFTTSTAFVPGTPQVGVTFTAPPSGCVYVTVYAQLECEGTGYAFCGYEIRSNDASGPVVVPASQDIAAAQQESRFSGSGRRKLIPGLTPGQRYYARTMHRSSSGTLTATIFHRAILVEPVYTEVAPSAPPPPGDPLDGAVRTVGGSTIRIPNGDLATSALRVRIPAGDRTGAAEALGIYLNIGTDQIPQWVRKTHFDQYGDLQLLPSAPGNVPITVQAAATQSADLLQIRDPSGNPVAGFRADGTLYAPNLGAQNAVPANSEATSAPSEPLLEHNRAYSIGVDDPNIAEFKVQGTPSAWLNEWGGYRAKSPHAWDPAVRLVRHANPTANTIEIQDEPRTQTLWGIDPNGYTVHGNGTAAPVKMAPVLALGASDPVPAGTPAGTVIVRTSQ